MKKKFKFILALGCLSFACAGLAACGAKTKVEENQAKGYKISVTYDANGGSFLNRQGVTIMDMFNPSDYEKGSDGKVHIKLMEPTSKDRPSSGGTISLTMSSHFVAGWYQTREVKTVNGVPVDNDGRELTEREDGKYVYADPSEEEKGVTVTPAYVYSDYWDFENDTVDYAEEDYEETDGICNITLYAAWVEYYEFNYYYKMEGQTNDQWQLMSETTTFNYKSTNEEGSAMFDRDTIWLPTWGECKMNYSHEYDNKSEYTFPQVSGTTFSKAYLDPQCTQEISESLEHSGTLVVDDGENESLKVENRVQNIYIVVEAGVQYRITAAEQLVDVKNVNPQGIYEIKADLDFTDLVWPSVFNTGTFQGKMYGSEGQTYTMSNITVKHSSSSKTGGLFGTIAATAEIKNLNFENVTFDLSSMGQKNNEASFGLFAGLVEDGATVTNVAIGGTFRLGEVTPGNDCTFNLWTNGEVTGLTKNAVKLQVYGVEWGQNAEGQDQYNYTVDPNSVTVNEEGGFTFGTTNRDTRYRTEESVDIN